MSLLRSGASFAVGSLPHRNAVAAAEFAWTATTIPTLPSLPRRSPAEGMLAQMVLGIEGVSVGQYGGISVDTSAQAAHPTGAIDLAADAFVGCREFLRAIEARPERRETTAVKLQCVGPATLGLALMRAGMPSDEALRAASSVVTVHIRRLQAIVREALPAAEQIVVVDEPSLRTALGDPGIDREQVLDAVSGALAAVGPHDVHGLHNCGGCDWQALFDAGAGVLSVPLPRRAALDELATSASRLAEHLALGGWVAWGVVRTDGPIPLSAERPWKNLLAAWTALTAAGVDPDALLSQALLTPVCGLGTHSEMVAGRVMSILRELSQRLSERASRALITGGS